MKEKVGVGIKENEIKAERAQDKEDLHCTLGRFSCACGGETPRSSFTYISSECSLLFRQEQLDRMRNKGRREREIERKLKNHPPDQAAAPRCRLTAQKTKHT